MYAAEYCPTSTLVGILKVKLKLIWSVLKRERCRYEMGISYPSKNIYLDFLIGHVIRLLSFLMLFFEPRTFLRGVEMRVGPFSTKLSASVLKREGYQYDRNSE